MKLADLKLMLNRAPFRAFRLHLNNGEKLEVPHPECFSAPPEPDADLFVVWSAPEWNLVDASQVARVSLISPKNGRPRS